MDANQTRFQLVFGKADWLGETPAGGSPPVSTVEFRDSDATVGLPQKVFVFPALRNALLGAADRRGAGQDRYGNYYWIAPGEDEILFLGASQQQAQHFWAAADLAAGCATASPADFTPLAPSPVASFRMAGLAVTTDHYLVVGLRDPAGLLVFDLYTQGPPLVYHWPADVAFVPFDLAAAPGGGVWILDRMNQRYWGLDSLFRVIAPEGGVDPNPTPEDFQPVGGGTSYRALCDTAERVSAAQAMAVAASHAIGIEALPDGSVLILDSPPSLGYSQLYRHTLAALAGPPVALNQLDIGEGAPYALLGQDLAFVAGSAQAAGTAVQGTLYIADAHGEQTFAFDYTSAQAGWAREPNTQFLPMLRFGGKALVTGPPGVSYDFDERWAVLAPQPRTRFETQAVWVLPRRDRLTETDPARRAFDGKVPGCVWHRLLMDGTIPAGTEIQVSTRAADSVDLLVTSDWNAEPAPYLRATGAELPYYQPALTCSGARTGTWELLFQAARGRYLQIQLTFLGNGRSTPRLQALRAYYPRFSYLSQYLPAVYRDNAASADFLDRYLANPEGFFTSIEGRIQQVQELFDSRTVPAGYLAWLAGWLGISFDFTWSETVRRFFLANAPRFFRSRGTPDGIVRMIRLALDQCASASLFDPADVQHFSVRIVEGFELRSAPGVVLGDPTDVQAPGTVAAGASWTPSQGSGVLDQQLRSFLSGAYATIEALNQAWGTDFTGFDDPALRLPAYQPSQAARAADWQRFISQDLKFTYAAVTNADEPAYEDFLKRRFSQPADLNQAYGLTGGSALASFSEIQSKLWMGQLGQGLPPSGTFLQDWIRFVSVVVPTQQSAHRFSVVVPVQLQDDVTTQIARRDLAQRITRQEKPAHTSFDVKLYWAAFSTGEARVGLETVVGPSSRFAALLLGQGSPAASFLGFVEPWNVRGRMVAGRDQLKQQTGIRCGEISK
ncbi:MAG: beta-galactosidase [Acidobacteriia bacterium]|nr:beta-galactosidase [Terriglobia bacterium]